MVRGVGDERLEDYEGVKPSEIGKSKKRKG